MKVSEVRDNNDKVEKLDTCMCIMFDYIGKLCSLVTPEEMGKSLFLLFESFLRVEFLSQKHVQC